MEKLVCKVCGGNNVQVRAWIDANTNEIQDNSCLDSSDTWCQDCEDHTGLMFEKDFVEENS